MKKEFKVLIIIFALFLVMGQSCKKDSGDDGDDDNDFKGKDGLVLSFVDGLPPEDIWKGIEFGIWIDVQNKGVNDVKEGRLCVSSLPSQIFGKGDSCIDLGEILGRRNFPGGQINTYGEEVWDGFSLSENYDVPVDTTYPITARACYEYSTVTAPLVCIRDLRMDERETVCEAGEIDVPSSQGGPVAVSFLKEEIVPRGDENELFFTIKVKNVGEGSIIKTGVRDEECRFEDRKEKDEVQINVELPGYGEGKCRNEGKIVMVNGEGQAFCSGMKVPKGQSFSLPLNIKLSYGYLSHIRGGFKLKKDLEEL